MKKDFFPAVRLTFVCIVVFMIIYPLLIWAIAQAAPNKGGGEVVSVNNRVVGYKLEGQNFRNNNYFNSRPSAVDYNAAGSGGSNKGPSNPDYLKQVKNRIDTLLAHNPGITTKQIPSELVTASASGLDPDISPAAAYIQVNRIAAVRKINRKKILRLIEKNTEQPLFGLFGTSKINVLKLNIELDTIK